ncbi:MAG: class I SAM-dependent methyltransferase [Gammaproteobacteria bacterium]
MAKRQPQADEQVDALYHALRDKHGAGDSKANGYVSHGYFLREQQILFEMLNPSAQVLVDVGCGSGLMCKPLIGQRELVVGLDFNRDACSDARRNGIKAVRGDAFILPFAHGSVDEIVCCQFFNQQNSEAILKFIQNSARVLKPGGRLIMIWRNGESYVHRIALFLARIVNRICRRPQFPYENHRISSIVMLGVQSGLVSELQAVSFPPGSWVSNELDTLIARWIGASNICILRKPVERNR